ncbi:MAG TPA: ABC transporter ATP-binding protein [Thermoanaerobaculia bacterium]|jgi:ABC-2 type transport system ATP-binding protein|nr:ABC transporter ATP-binding protein [Thermoanaerobaculia bacterium]
MTPAIVCRGLKKHYGDVKAVDGLDLEVRAGECFGLLGPNGAGKTTTIEILEGLTPPDAGEVVILGRRWGSQERELRERLGISLQESRLTEKLTVAETLGLFRSFYSRGRDPEQLMADLSLEEKRDARVGKLSGGQRQRLAVACALAGDPELLFLDEPTTGLDPQSRLQLWERIAAYKEAGRSVLLTTHYMEEAERLCDRVAVVDHGRIIAQGSPADLIAGLKAPHFIEFSTEPPVEDALLARIPGAGERRQRDGRWLLAAASLAQAVPALLAALDGAGAKLLSLSTHRATLEDVFIGLTGRELRDE